MFLFFYFYVTCLRLDCMILIWKKKRILYIWLSFSFIQNFTQIMHIYIVFLSIFFVRTYYLIELTLDLRTLDQLRKI